jgi:hypothetical protein
MKSILLKLALFFLCLGWATAADDTANILKTPFPEGIPLEHFSYFNYPTDVVGFMDSREGAEITPEGHIYTGYTELVFMQGAGLSYFPVRRHYWLEKEYLPIHYWEYRIDGIQYRFSTFAAPLDLDPEKNLIVFIRVRVKNNSRRTRPAILALGTRYSSGQSERDGSYAPFRHRFRRPAKPLRPGLYEQEGERFSRKWKFRFQDNALLRNGKILYAFSASITPELFSYTGYKAKGDKGFKQPSVPSSPVGIARFGKMLKPGEDFAVTIKMPYTPVESGSGDADAMRAPGFEEMKKKTAAFWDNILARGMQIDLPEKKPGYVYKTSLIYDLIARDKIGEHYAQKVNEFHYDAFWLRDSAYIVRAYDLGGYHDIARQCLEFFFRWQKEDGNFLSQGGQFDGWGQTLWALGQHYRLTGDKELAERALPAIMKATVWLKEQLKKDPLGIMPLSTPGDNEAIEGGHVTGHNFWALAGLKNAVAMAEGIGKKSEAARLKALYKQLYRNFNRALKKVLKGNGNYIPPGLDQPGGQDWGNLMAVYPEEILAPHHPAVTETLKRSRAKYREKIMTYWNTEYLHHYLTMKNTETSIIRGDQEDVLDEFYAILAHTSSTQAGFEFSINPWSNRDFRANLTPHGWFAAKYRNVLRSMLVRERENTLHLLSVISPAWAKPGKHIRVKDAPTYFGKISFTATFKPNGMDLRIDPRFKTFPTHIAVHIPYFVTGTHTNKGKLKSGVILLSPRTRDLSIKWKPKPGAPYYGFEKMVNWLKEQYK